MNHLSPVPWLFNELWLSESYEVSYFMSAFCACKGINPGKANINCKVCHGFGWFYPYPGVKLCGLVSDLKMRKDLLAVGMGEPGDLLFSPEPGQAHLSDYDLILLPWKQGVPSEGQVIIRGGNSALPANQDETYYRMDWVQGAWVTSPATGVVTSYTPGVDFTWDGRTITWVGNQPSAGATYSIQYSGLFEWISFVSPQPRIAFGQDLGQRVILRKRHIVTPNAPLLVAVD